MVRIKQFDWSRRRVAQHPDDSPQKAVLSRWLTLAGGAGTGIKADSPPAFKHLERSAGGWGVFEHLLPISWHRRPSSAADAARLSRPRDPARPPPTGTRRLLNSIPNGRLALLSLDVMD